VELPSASKGRRGFASAAAFSCAVLFCAPPLPAIYVILR